MTINRERPASPSPIVVSANTTVTIRLVGARANESVTFTPTTTENAPVDVGTAFLKNAIGPLQSLVASQHALIGTPAAAAAAAPPPPQTPEDPIASQLRDDISRASQVIGQLAIASAHLQCLESYDTFSELLPTPICTAEPLSSATYPAAKQATIDAMRSAGLADVPLDSLSSLESTISNETPKNKAHLSLLALLKTILDDTQKTQVSVLELAAQLAVTPSASTEVDFSLAEAGNYTSSIVVASQEVMSKTTTTIATVSITWQKNPWTVATGVLFSALKGRAFSNAPLLKDGQPQLDDQGKNLTVVQEVDTRPTILLPVVTLSYRIGLLSNAKWANACPNHCGFLITGGVGLNLTSKTAEFVAGPSFQIGSLMVSTVVHLGRDTTLTRDLAVGTQLGSSPPDPLPQESKWKGKFAVLLSYSLPFQ